MRLGGLVSPIRGLRGKLEFLTWVSLREASLRLPLCQWDQGQTVEPVAGFLIAEGDQQLSWVALSGFRV